MRTRFTFDPADDRHPVWSPDDTRLAFTSEQKTGQEIRMRSVSGQGVPFYHLASLGSERGGRAYHQLRFRDLAMAAFMLEWRWEVWRELHERSRIEDLLSVRIELTEVHFDVHTRNSGPGPQ